MEILQSCYQTRKHGQAISFQAKITQCSVGHKYLLVMLAFRAHMRSNELDSTFALSDENLISWMINLYDELKIEQKNKHAQNLLLFFSF